MEPESRCASQIGMIETTTRTAAVRQSDERTGKIEAGQSRLRALRQRQQAAR